MFSTTTLVAAFYILGIYLTDSIGLSATFFLFLTLLIAGAIKNRRRGALFLAAFAIILGVIRYGIASDSPLVRNFHDKYVTAEGLIFSQKTESGGEYKNRYILELDTISYVGTTYRADGRVILNTKEEFKFGDVVRVSGFLSEINGVDNEFEYDFSAYYKSRDIWARIVARKAERLGMLSKLTPEFISGIIKERISEEISRNYEGNRAGLLKAILLNDKSGFDREYREMLIRTGVYRSLYSPYMHISLIFLLAGIFRRERKSRERLAVVLLIAYALFNSTSPTVIKACAITILLIFKKEICGFADKLQILSLIVLVLTLADPMLCFCSGFVISVLSTVLIYFSYTPIYRKILEFLTKRKIRSQRLAAVLTVWMTFTVGTIPVCALFYSGVSMYSTLYSALMIPIAAVLIPLSVPVLLFMSIFGGAQGLILPSDLILAVVEYLSHLADKLPFSFLEMRAPSLREIVIFYLGWWIFLRAICGEWKSDKTKILVTVAIAFVALGFSEYSVNTLSVNFVNVGQGDGAVLHTTRGETVIIDGGGSPEYQDNYNIGEQVFVPYLVSHGFADIDVAILTHPHKDHAEGVIAASKKLKIDTLVMPDVAPDNQYRKALEKLSEERKFKIEYLSSGDEIRFKSGLSIKFIAPDTNHLKSKDLNDSSLVAHITYGEFDAVFTGDSAGGIKDRYPENAELLKVAHHGSEEENSEEYIKHISPEYAVISVGEGNQYGLPDIEVIERLKKYGAKVIRTDKSGDIRFKVKKDGKITYKTLKGE